MFTGNRPVIVFAKWLAAVTALAISLGIPAGYLYFGYQQATGAISAESVLLSQEITRLVSSNPDYWQFETIRIEELIGRHQHDPGGDSRRVTDRSGNLVAGSSTIAPDNYWPILSQRQSLYDYGVAAGYLDITYSLKTLYSTTLLVALFSIFAGLLIYWGLRVLPLRSLERAWDRLSFLASHDALTGLPNRVLFLDRLEQSLSRAQRRGRVVTVHSIDLDYFKDVNDTLGHAAGDSVLRQAAERMTACVRPEDTVARLSGDEFAIIQNDSENATAAAVLAARVIDRLSAPFHLNGQDVIIAASVGMASSTPGAEIGAGELLKNADLALYKSKASGRSTYHFFEEKMDTELQKRKSLEADLRMAQRKNQFSLSYQPQIDLATQRVVGVETLLRWHHPDRGEVPPAEFIPVAESSGLILPLTEWILHTACKEAANWAPLRVAVNLSPDQFTHRNLVGTVESALRQSGMPADRLELEITEDVLIKDTERTLVVLNTLKSLGVRIAMDDFGTGYSSLGYLRRFPFDKIKIDRSFIADLSSNTDAQAIVRAIISLGRALGIHVNAEGVETIEQATALQVEGCEEVQGYFYGMPMAKTSIEELLKRMGAIAPSDAPTAAATNQAGRAKLASVSAG
jgi:diguanylate cyclase (GGDEF)-like protein